MTILTDELSEKVARRICAAANDCINDKCESCEKSWPKYLPEARAALTAILPMLVEECAKAARGHDNNGWSSYSEGRQNAASDVRSLMTKEK